MSKKHFEEAAAYLRSFRMGTDDEQTARAIENAFVDVFRQFNARFDESRFRAACQVAR